MSDHYDAIVIAGGRASRLGGADKPALSVGGRTLLDRTLSACSDAVRTVVVGPRRPANRPVLRTIEDPPGSGPLAALDAGLRHTTQPVVLVLSADLPFLTAETVRDLVAVPPKADGVVLVDEAGRLQPLIAAYRAEPLRRELALVATEHGRLGGLPLHLLLPGLALRQHRATDSLLDCDTWEDLAAARARIREHGVVLDEWIAAVRDELDLDLDVDTTALLDLARDAAHGVARPAAPLTTFLVGYAVAQRGGDLPDVTRRVSALAARWAAEQSDQSEPSEPPERGVAGGTPGGEAAERSPVTGHSTSAAVGGAPGNTTPAQRPTPAAEAAPTAGAAGSTTGEPAEPAAEEAEGK